MPSSLVERLRSNPRTAIKVVGLPLIVAFAILTNLPSQTRGTVGTPRATDAELEAFIANEVRDAGVPGAAMAIVRDGRVSDTKGFGVADSQARPVTADTPFIIGSLTKSITALAVLQLVDAHAVDLDTPAGRYLPEFTLADRTAAATITVRQLLNQTSGIGSAAGERPLGQPATTLDAQVRALADVALNSPPGTKYAYSNSNYEVLGLLIERVSGQPYGEYVEQHVFAPLEMTHSHTALADAQADGLTRAHRLWFGFADDRAPIWRTDLQPAGFLAASAQDIGHLVAAELNGGVYDGSRVASTESIALSQHGTSAMGTPDAGSYGFGWADLQVGDLRVVGHAGSTTDMASVVFFAPDQKLGIVLLLNAQSTLYEVVHKPDFIASAALQKLAGREPGGTLGMLYPAVDVVAILLIGFALWRLANFTLRARRGTAQRPILLGKPSLGIALAAFLYLVVPIEILVNVPRFLGAPWTVLSRIDIGLVAGSFALLRLATGLLLFGPLVVGWLRSRSGLEARSKTAVIA